MSKRTSWENKNKSYVNYMEYIDNKERKFKLTLIDLLYISNFKGGNACIHEHKSDVDEKLEKYSECLKAIENEFKGKKLENLTDEELNSLKEKAETVIRATDEENTEIFGFKTYYAAAMLHFYFPNLLPIMDENVIDSTNIKPKEDNSNQSIDEELNYYFLLIDEFYRHLRKHPEKSVREYDKELFIN